MKKKVIVAEDDLGIREVLQLILGKAGYEVQAFPHGNHLMKELFELPDIFLIDKQLSGVDGLDICRHLKAQPATHKIPLVILSATPHIGLLVKSAGAQAFIEKPFSNKHLLETVEQLINQRAHHVALEE